MKRVGLVIAEGRCWACSCTNETPCVDPDLPRPYAWVDEKENFCTSCALLYASLVFNAPGSVFLFEGIAA